MVADSHHFYLGILPRPHFGVDMSVKKLILEANRNRLKVVVPSTFGINGDTGYGNIYCRKDRKITGPYHWYGVACFAMNKEYCLNGFLIRVSEII